eukprot:6376015-Lingulodinium_polyedra.AAC.1
MELKTPLNKRGALVPEIAEELRGSWNNVVEECYVIEGQLVKPCAPGGQPLADAVHDTHPLGENA